MELKGVSAKLGVLTTDLGLFITLCLAFDGICLGFELFLTKQNHVSTAVVGDMQL